MNFSDEILKTMQIMIIPVSSALHQKDMWSLMMPEAKGQYSAAFQMSFYK